MGWNFQGHTGCLLLLGCSRSSLRQSAVKRTLLLTDLFQAITSTALCAPQLRRCKPSKRCRNKLFLHLLLGFQRHSLAHTQSELEAYMNNTITLAVRLGFAALPLAPHCGLEAAGAAEQTGCSCTPCWAAAPPLCAQHKRCEANMIQQTNLLSVCLARLVVLRSTVGFEAAQEQAVCSCCCNPAA